MKIDYDKTADALYIYFRKGKVSKTKKIARNFIVDFGGRGEIIGIEILSASLHVGGKKSKNMQIEIPLATA